MTAVTFPDRVAARMLRVRPGAVALSVLAAPFYLLGLVVGLLAFVVLWVLAAVGEGFDAGRGRSGDRR